MIPRGSGRRAGLVIVLTGVLIVGITLLAYRSPAAPKGPANPATSTLNVALPGPFNGCSYLSPSATATTSAILDLIRPSAFLTGPANVLYGEGGAIVSAELISLHPETVVYSVAKKMTWSDGKPFRVSDLITWWRSARNVLSINGDGYRAISSMVVNATGTAVTATFSTDFADWNLLFRDVEATGTTRSCQISQLRTQPSLGPYRVQSATTSRIVLISNPEWTIDYNRFHRVIITSSPNLPTSGSRYFVKYAAVATPTLVSDLVAHPRYLGELSDSSDVVELTFSPVPSLTRQAPMRTALSWLLERKNILTSLFGGLTFSPSVPTSALFSQGQTDYPLPKTTVIPTAANANLVDPSQDCRTCATTILHHLGYVRDTTHWRSATGAPLRVTLAQGPSTLDHVTAHLVALQWSSQGVDVGIRSAASDDQAAFLASTGAVDAAVFDRPTSTTAWVSARSWGRTPYIDSYPSGVRSNEVNKLFALAQGTFNPATAALTWLEIDHDILTNFWVRPLYTVPSFVSWSSPVANVVSALSLSGFVDQLTNWGIVTPSTATTVGASTSPIG